MHYVFAFYIWHANHVISGHFFLTVATENVCLRMELIGGLIGHFLKYHNTLCLPSKIFCMRSVSSFPGDLQWSQEKTKTMLMQTFGGQTKSIMVFLKMAYLKYQHGRCDVKWNLRLIHVSFH